MSVFKLLTKITFYILVFLIYWIQSYTWLTVLTANLFHINFKLIGIMIIAGAVIALLVCFFVRFSRKRYPVVFRLLILLHFALLFYTIHTFSSFNEPIRIPVQQGEQK